MEQTEVTQSTQPRFVSDTFPVTANDGDTLVYQNYTLYVWWRGVWKLQGMLKFSTAGYVKASTRVDTLSFQTDAVSSLKSNLINQKAGLGFGTPDIGYFACGVITNATSSIEKLVFSSNVLSTLSSTWARTISYAGSLKGQLAGYSAGGATGAGTLVTNIDKLTYATEQTSTVSTSLAVATYYVGETESYDAGYAVGGSTGGYVSTIRKLLFSAETSSNLASSLSSARIGVSGCSQITTAGYLMCGTPGSYLASVTTIDKLLFSDDTRTTLGSGISPSRFWGTALYSLQKGYYCGGLNTSYVSVSTVNRLVFSDETTSSVATNLTVGASDLASTEN